MKPFDNKPFGIPRREPRNDVRLAILPVRKPSPRPDPMPTPISSSNCCATAMTEATGLKLAALSYAQLMTAGEHPVTSIATTFYGEQIGVLSVYQKLYTNNLGRAVAVRVAMDNGANLGARVALSFGNELSNQNKIDELYASGTLNSNWILLRHNKDLWINTLDTAQTCDGVVFRVLLFDPASLWPDIIS